MLENGFESPYTKASYIDKLRETNTIGLTDLDGTHATRAGSPQEMNDRAGVRRFLSRNRYVAGAVTARTPALTMSSAVYEASRKLGFQEPPPHWGMRPDRTRYYVPLEEFPFFNHSLDWDVVAGLGSGIFPKNGHGHLIDHEYDELLRFDHDRSKPKIDPNSPIQASLDLRVPWRDAVMAFLGFEWKDEYAKEHLSPLESTRNYLEGKTDVAPLPYRIQLGFKGEKGLERMRELKALIDQKSSTDPIAMRMVYVDESKPDSGEYTLYLLPKVGQKERMINRLVAQSAAAAGLDPSQLRLFYAGDTPTDLRAGLYAGTNLTFLLATGSLLAPYLIERRPYYGDEPLDILWESPTRPSPRLLPTNEKGVYRFKVSGRQEANTIVIGDERYPGTTPPGSVLTFLEEFAQPQNAVQ